MSEDLVSGSPRPLGRYEYRRLGATTLLQLKRQKLLRKPVPPEHGQRKPDAIIYLPLGGIKAVVEVKPPAEMKTQHVPNLVETYAPIALGASCKVLILTDSKRSIWVNALTGKPILNEDGDPVTTLVDPTTIEASKVTPEAAREIVDLIEKADHSLSETNNQFEPLRVIDPTPLARTVWQKIWINTGKEPERCLYNVVEILVFKFLSDLGVLAGNYAFRRVVEIIAPGGKERDEEALDHYAKVTRDRIRILFPKGADDTTIINGTIFVNEAGQPNLSQAGLFCEVIRAFQAFDDEHGSLRYIDRSFKTRLYESFLRQSAGVKALGQYFTPRNVVQSMVRMSEASRLKAGDSLCDPFCGVGGFVLEAIAENSNLQKEFEPKKGKVAPAIVFRGYDKGTDEKDDERTIILAKANMLVYLSDFLARYPSEAHMREFAGAFNDVFRLLRTNLGAFGQVEPGERYDLILTNPPYVTSGTSSLRGAIESQGLGNHYSVGGRGTESLAIQWIVEHLKPSGHALIVAPDGLLNQSVMTEYIKSTCRVLAIVALPSRTFYSTPKKTYILSIRRNEEEEVAQTTPVFTYLVSEIGESRDARRVRIEKNDLETMEQAYKYFRVDPNGFSSADPRCKILPWEKFDALRTWLVDRLWTHDEKVELGIAEEVFEVDGDTLVKMIEEAGAALDALRAALK
jgi:type I restriction-modification system DNA methylase subunit